MIKIRRWQRWQKYCLNNEFEFFLIFIALFQLIISYVLELNS